MRIALLFVLILCITTYVESKSWRHKIDSKSGMCTFENYIPGGALVDIETVTAPTAKLQLTAIQAIFTHSTTGRTNALIGVTQTVLDSVALISKEVLEVAGKLGPALGLFTGVMGAIIDDKTPTADDILEATNKAIEELADEVNKRLDEMKDYVDQKVVNFEKDIVERKYKFHFTYWAECIRGVDSQKVNLCQEEAYRLISASLGEFALFHEKLNRRSGKFQHLSDEEKRRIEVNLITFRNYVQLAFMVLNVVKESYKDDNSVNGQKTYALYKKEMKSKAELYQNYTVAAVEEIVALNSDLKDKCMNTLTCTEPSTIETLHGRGRAGRKRPHYDESICSCTLSSQLPATCNLKIQVVYDGRELPGSRVGNYDTNNIKEVHTLVAQQYFTSAEVTTLLQDSIKTKVDDYWDEEVLAVIKCVKKLANGEDCTIV